MTMIERVAKAIAENRFGGSVHWNFESDAWRQSHIDLAIAAIKAMREPTEAMLHAKHPDHTDGVDDYLDYWDAIDVWQAMIDAALEE